MRDYRDAKAMASALRSILQAKQITLSHGECLEIVAKQLGLKDWNVLAARIGDGEAPSSETPPSVQPRAALPMPAGWRPAGSRPDLYEMGLDRAMVRHDRPAAVIRALHPEQPAAYAIGVFGTLMQSAGAERHRGRRLALEAELRTVDATAAWLWLRIDKAPGQVTSFDNMMDTRRTDESLKGNRDWTICRVVLDVAEDAASLNFGFALSGAGTVWSSGFRLSEVGEDVPPTSTGSRQLKAPDNLDFTRDEEAT